MGNVQASASQEVNKTIRMWLLVISWPMVERGESVGDSESVDV